MSLLTSRSTNLSASLLVRVEAAWQQLERLWRDGASPRLEHAVADFAPHDRPYAFKELLLSEWEWRRDQEPDFDPESACRDYAARFPQFRDVIVDLLHAAPGERLPRALGKYLLVQVLGQGGMGVVYRAKVRGLGREVAVKVCQSSKPLKRFLREMQVTALLRHDHLVELYDSGHHDGQHFYVMQLLKGCNLQQLVTSRGNTERISVADACALIRQAALGLDYARSVIPGLTHRDLKPANLMLARDGGVARVKVLDLGLVRTGTDATTMVGGTADYMAPEQFRCPNAVDTRADIYALGTTLFFLLAGRAPYAHATTIESKFHAHLFEPLPAIRDVRDDIPKEVVAILNRATAKAPGDRFDHPGQLAEALAPLAAAADLNALLTRSECVPTVDVALLADEHASILETRPSCAANSTDTWPSPARWSRRRFLTATGVVTAGTALGVSRAVNWTNRLPNIPPPESTTVASYPGMNGDWWFDEIPWFFPALRAELLQALSHDEVARLAAVLRREDGISAFHEQLKELMNDPVISRRISSRSRGTLDVLNNLAIREHGQEARGQESLLDDLARAPESAATAADRHLHALVLHRRALLSQRGRAKDAHDEFAEAKRTYEEALEQYRQVFDASWPAALSLKVLCHSDYARLLFDAVTHAGKYSNECGTSWGSCVAPTKPEFDIFRIVWEAKRSEVLRTLYGPATLEAEVSLKEADSRLEGTRLAELHPLRAYVAERRGWRLVNVRDPRAADAFAAARTIRNHQVQSPRPSAHQQRALIGALHCALGQAIAVWEGGDEPHAQTLFSELAGHASLQDDHVYRSSDLTQTYRHQLAERYLNTQTRWAEFQMVTGDTEDARTRLKMLKDRVHVYDYLHTDRERQWTTINLLLAERLAGVADGSWQSLAETKVNAMTSGQDANDGEFELRGLVLNLAAVLQRDGVADGPLGDLNARLRRGADGLQNISLSDRISLRMALRLSAAAAGPIAEEFRRRAAELTKRRYDE